jgi:hypothetical protein
MRLNDTTTATPQFGVSLFTINRAGLDVKEPRNEGCLNAH